MASPVFDAGGNGGGSDDKKKKEEEQSSWWDSWAAPDENTDRGYYPQPNPATTPAAPGQPSQADWAAGPVNVPAPQRGYDPRWDDPNYGEEKKSSDPLPVFGGGASRPDLQPGQQAAPNVQRPYASFTEPWRPPQTPSVDELNSYSGPWSSPQVTAPKQSWADSWTAPITDAWNAASDWYSGSAGGKAAYERSQNRWESYEEQAQPDQVGGREVDYFSSPQVQNNDTIDWGVAKPFVQGAADLGTGALNLGIDAWNWGQSTEAGDSFADKLDAGGNYVMDALDFVDAATVKPIATGEVADNLSIGAAAESLGQGLLEANKIFSPIGGYAGPQSIGESAIAATTERAEQHRKARELVENLEEDGVTDANLALLRTYTGPEAIEKAATAIATQGDNVTALEVEAQNLQAQAAQADTEEEAENLMYQAAVVGAKAEDLKKKSPLEVAEEEANVWKELGFELVLDPLNAVGWIADMLGASVKAGQVRRAGKFVDNAPAADEAAEVLAKAFDEAMQSYGDLGMAATKGQINWVNPNPLTPQAQAEIAANELYRSVGVLVGNSKTRTDAKAVVDSLVNNPKKLIEDITEAVGGDMQRLGLGTLSDKSITENMDVLIEAAGDIAGLKSLDGDGIFNPAVFMAELDDVLESAAARVQGLTPARLPDGAVQVKKYTDEATGQARLDYVDAKGEVVKSSTYSQEVAERTYKEANQALKGKVPGQAWKSTEKAIRSPSDFVRSLMSESFLNMRPNNWVKQAVGAVGHLMADGHNAFHRIADVDDWMSAKFGFNTPSRKMTEAIGMGENLTGQIGSAVDQTNRSMFRNVTGGKQNPLSWWSEKGGEFWQKNELNFRKRATYSRTKQVFEQQWKKNIKGEFIPQLMESGLNEQQARIIGDLALDAGVAGGIQDVQSMVRRALDSPMETFSLRSLGIDDEVLSSPAVKEIYDLVAGRTDVSPDDFMRGFDDIITREQSRYAQILHDAPVTPRQYAWTAVDDVYDGPEIVDEMVEAAKKAGMDPAAARKEAEGITRAMSESERAAYQRMLDDVASTQNDGQLWAAADMWMEIRDLKQTYRQRVGDWARAAMDPDEAYTWDQYFNNAKETWTKFGEELGGLSDNYRGQISGTEGRRRLDVFEIMERHAKADWANINAQRSGAAGRAVGDNEAYQKVIDASRTYVDEFANNLYSTFKRYTTTDALDLVTSAEIQVQKAGQQAAGYVAHLRSQMLDNKMMPEAFREQRDKVWQEFSDTAALLYNNATREVARRGVATETPSGLKWADDFAGGEFELIHIGETQNGRTVAMARRIDDGSMHEFALPGGGAGDTATKVYESTPELERLGQAQGELQGLKDARNEMRQQWYATATAAGGENKIDQIVATYKRGGRVSLPESFGEDLIGETILGVPINSTDDLEQAINSYAQMADQVARLEGEAKGLSGAKPKGRLALPEVPQGVYDDYQDVLAESDRLVRGDNGLPVEDGLPVPEFNPDDVAPRGADAAAATASNGDAAAREASEYDPWEALRENRRNNPTTVGPNSTGIFGLEEGEDFADSLGRVNRGYQQTGGAYQPNVGDIASYYFDRLEDSRRAFAEKATQITSAGSEVFSQEQRLRAVDALSNLTGKWQDVTNAAIQAGEEAADFAMLDYSRGRRLDKWLGTAVPYHYYYTRSMKNWARRTATRPDLLMNYRKVDKAVEDQNDSTALRTTGQIEVPINDDVSAYIQNPMDLLLPFGTFGTNDYARPEEAQTAVGRMVENAKLVGFGLMPYMDAAVKYADGRGDEIDIGDYSWQWRSLGYLKQAATGTNLPGGGDKWDPYRAATKAAVEGQRYGQDPSDASFAQDVIYQQQSGAEALPEQARMSPNAEQLALNASRGAGADRALTLVLRDLFGITVTPYANSEQEMRDTSAEYGQLGYGEQGPFGPVDNPAGSKAATKGYFDANPYAKNWWGRSDLVPGADEKEGFNRPALDPIKDASSDTKSAAYDSIYAASDAGVDEYVAANPEASKAEMNEAKKQAAITAAASIVGDEAIAQFLSENPSAWVGDIAKFAANTSASSQYPSAEQFQYPESDNHPFRNMNPAESKEKLTDDAVKAAKRLEGAPVWPGDGATRAEKAKYREDKEAFDTRKEAYLDSLLGMIDSGDYAGLQGELYPNEQDIFSPNSEVTKADTFGPPTQQEAAQAALSRPSGPIGADSVFGPPAGPQAGTESGTTSPTAADLLSGNQYTTEAEQARLDEIAAENAQTGAEIDATIERIRTELGDEAAKLYQDYLLAEDEQRLQIKATDPRMKVLQMIAFEPDNYQAVKQQFGNGSWEEWSNIPTWDGSPEQDAARREYFAANPRAKAVNAFVRGRPGRPTVDGDPSTYNDWGKDYQEAQRRFGDDIFQVWAGYNSGWDKATKRAYFAANPKLSEFNDFWYANFDGSQTKNPRSPYPASGGDAAVGAGPSDAARREEAKGMFGDDIFDVWSGYDKTWDKETKNAYFEKHPQLSKFWDYWYGNEEGGGGARNRRGVYDKAFVSSDGKVHYDKYGRRLDSLGHVARGGWGGGWSGGGGGGGDASSGINSFAQVQRARLNPREMQQYGPTRAWEAPYFPNLNAVNNARQQLGPRNLEAWRLPQKVPTLG